MFSFSGRQQLLPISDGASYNPGFPLLRAEQWRNTMSKSDTDTRTDAACTAAGIYRSDSADQERVTLAVGDTFPRCPSTGAP